MIASRILQKKQTLSIAKSTSRLFSTSSGATQSSSAASEEQEKQQFKSEREVRKALVKAAFIHAKRVGFNDNALVEACKDFDFPPVTASVVPRGPIEIVDYAMEFWLHSMHEDLTARQDELKQLKVRQRVHEGIKTRLEYVQPYVNYWPQAMNLGLKPQNLPNTFSQIHAISDEVWFQLGDQSLDFSWYTKRALVSKLYAVTEIYMLQDKSDNFEATWEFLDRRIDNVMTVGQTLNQNKNLVNAVGGGIGSILNMAQGFVLTKDKPVDDSEMLRQQREVVQKQEAESSKKE